MERTKPTGENGGKVRAGIGDYDTTTLDGVFNFGMGDMGGVKLTASYRDQGEGFVTNNITGRKDGQVEYTAFGINPLFKPTEGLEIELTYLQERTDQDTPPLLNLAQPGQVFCAAFGICSPDLRTPTSGDRYHSDQAWGDDVTWALGEDPNFSTPLSPYDTTYDADTLQFEVRYDINDHYRLDYIYGSWDTEEEVVTDWDAVQEFMFHTDRPAEYEQDTHEIRLTYDAGENFSYTAGAYFWDSKYEIRLLSWIGFAIPNFILPLPQTTQQTSESWAVFFEGDYAMNDQWTLTAGGRHTQDDKTSNQIGNAFTTTAYAESDWSEFTPKLALKYQLNDDAMVYGLYSRGYRAGGFNGRVDSVETATTPYDPETVDNFELGYKSTKLDGRMTFNVTAFYMDYKDKQEEIQQPSATSGTGQVTRVVNASSATISGLEFELMYLAENGLILRANLGLLDADYDEFKVNTGTADAPVITDFSDLEFRRAPELTASLSAMYQWSTGSGTGDFQASWHYIDDHAVDFLNKPELNNDAQNLVNASVNYGFNNWRFSLFGNNLLDEDGYGIGFDVANLWSYAAARPPRTYGFEVSYSW
jgi:iron complex outermembrane receptor protein